jgi:hypothetical protein
MSDYASGGLAGTLKTSLALSLSKGEQHGSSFGGLRMSVMTEAA